MNNVILNKQQVGIYKSHISFQDFKNFKAFSLQSPDPETAIVVQRENKHPLFFILTGDHREALKDKTLKDCLNYFLANRKYINLMSDHVSNAFDILKTL